MDENILINNKHAGENKHKVILDKLKEISARRRYCIHLTCLWVAIITSLVILATLLLWSERLAEERAAPPYLVCYYSTPGGARGLQPRDIHPHLCTHINVAFARIVNNTIKLDPDQIQTIVDTVHLKSINPDLKILLSVGGAGGDDGFRNMVLNHANRKIFIKSLKYTLRNYTLDGVDLDWEFPAVHNMKAKTQIDETTLGKRERQHFSQLLHEIRSEYIREKRDYLLTVAVAAPEIVVNAAYDVDQIDLYVDFVNIMTYDYHYYTKYTPFTGLNSPLYARRMEQLYLATLNINYTVSMYISKGLSKDKIVVGIPTYGHSFTLVNPDNAAIGSPVSGFGSLGSQGFINYPDACEFIQKYKNDVVVKLDLSARVPYFYRDQEWVSFDTPQSVKEKVKYIREHGLRGAMIYSLNADDYAGKCTKGSGDDFKFPLVQAAKNILTQQ